jgi:hypothetical protein
VEPELFAKQIIKKGKQQNPNQKSPLRGLFD